MVLVAGCLGLRVSEIVALKWADFDFEGLTLLVQRSRVHGRVGDVKTEYSRDSVPLESSARPGVDAAQGPVLLGA
jgi:integrase